jgi:hypothetical protein
MEKLELLDSSTSPSPHDSYCSSYKGQLPPSSLHHTASSPWTAKLHGLLHSPSWQQGQKGRKGESLFKKKKEAPIRGEERTERKEGGGKLLEGQRTVGCWRRIPAPFFQLFFGGQQRDGRLFNSKFSKDLHA